MKPFLLIIAGPTGTGKSELGIELALRLNGEIIGADSRQIYAGMPIGTAQPSDAEMTQVPHHLFGFCSPLHPFTVAEYQQMAEQKIAEIQQRKRLPVLVGGTGLYLKTVLYQYEIPEVPPQPDLRQQYEAQEQQMGAGYLYQQLQTCDRQAAEKLHPSDLRRIIRALEVYHVTGQPISQWQNRSETLRYPCVYIGLQMNKEVLYRRLQGRIQNMTDGGLIEEVQQLRETYGRELPLLQTINYREIGDYLDGTCMLAEAQEAMFIHSRQFAKRQMTWFRKDPGIQWLDWPPQHFQTTVEHIQQQCLAIA